MSDWDPDLYTRFERERTRPAHDLLAAVPLETPADIVDLGCGPGNSTELLVRRFPTARVTGLDSSPAMIAAARERLPPCNFVVADLATWRPSAPPDLIFANAVLQWLPDHTSLLPRLFGMLDRGGVLAIQMPDNIAEPSHRLMREVAAESPWTDRLQGVGRPALAPAEDYYDLLSKAAAAVDVWRTAYHHPMPTPAAIVDWVRATGLRPFVDALLENERPAFLARYEARIDSAYPVRVDGQRLLAFPRLFIVAQRPI